MAEPRDPFLNRRVREIYRDEVLWVLDKPPGVLSHPNPPQAESKNALILAPYDFEAESYSIPLPGGRRRPLFLIHRLDQDTSGLILCAFSPDAAARLKEALYHREVRKEYRALVLGFPDPPEGTWRDHLEKRQEKGKIRVVAVRGRSPNAETRYRTIQAFPECRAAYMALEPETGRTHQLRVQAASRGLPIAGDDRYGDFAANRRLLELIGLRRMFLQAYRLDLRHPATGHRMTFVAELSRALAEPLGRLSSIRGEIRKGEGLKG